MGFQEFSVNGLNFWKPTLLSGISGIFSFVSDTKAAETSHILFKSYCMFGFCFAKSGKIEEDFIGREGERSLTDSMVACFETWN